MDKQTKMAILKKIKDRSEISDEDDCVIWIGKYKNKNVPIVNHKSDEQKYNAVNIIRFLWAYNYPNIPIKPGEKLVRTCDNPKCVNIEHIKPRTTAISKQGIWKRMLKHSKRNKNKKYDDNFCLEWTGFIHYGYGKIGVKNASHPVHRVSYWIHHDEYDNIEDIPKNNKEGILEIAHKCNNSKCFEFSHLKLCSRIENNSKDKLANDTLLRGTRSNFCTITEELAQKIKLSKTISGDKNHMTQKERAEKFGVSLKIVSSIDEGRSWAHLLDKNGKAILGTSVFSIQRRQQRKDAKRRVWTPEDFKKAQEKLESRSKLDDKGSLFEKSYCLLWVGSICKGGYGKIGVNNQLFSTHKLACCIKNKTLETNGLQVRHLCGKKLCINPLHLKFGTPKENAADKKIHGTAGLKLTIKTANKIRSQHQTGIYTYSKLAKKYNVSAPTISNIVRNKIYIDNSIKKYSGSKINPKKSKSTNKIPNKPSKSKNDIKSGSKTSKSGNNSKSGSKTSKPKKSSKSGNKSVSVSKSKK